jgi:hypothetical protein
LLLVLLALVLGVRALLPRVLEWAIESQGSERLGRLVRVGNVDLSVLAGGVEIDDLAVGPLFEGEEPPAELDAGAALLQSARIGVRWSWTALLRGEIHLEGVEIESPRLVAVTGLDGRLVPVVRPPAVEVAPQEAPPDADDGGSSWPLRLDRLALSDLDFYSLNLAVPEQAAIELRSSDPWACVHRGCACAATSTSRPSRAPAASRRMPSPRRARLRRRHACA